jgi:hypothetical protein
VSKDLSKIAHATILLGAAMPGRPEQNEPRADYKPDPDERIDETQKQGAKVSPRNQRDLWPKRP